MVEFHNRNPVGADLCVCPFQIKGSTHGLTPTKKDTYETLRTQSNCRQTQ